MNVDERMEKALGDLGEAIGPADRFVGGVMERLGRGGADAGGRFGRRLVFGHWRAVAAAAVVAACTFGVWIVNQSTSTAYAVEQTVEALENVRFLHLRRYDRQGRLKDERWIEIGMDGFQVRYRQQSPEGVFAIEDGESTGVYHHDKETVAIYDRDDMQYQWVSHLGECLENLRREGEVIEENDEYMGRAAHRVLWPMMGAECYVDPKTKLPIAIGDAEFSYEEPAAGIFEIAVPQGYAVVDMRPGAETGPIPRWLEAKEAADDSFRKATYALAEGRYVEAVELFEAVLKEVPKRNWAWFWLGKAYYELGQYDPAIEKYNKVLEMFGGQICHYCYYARALAYDKLEMYDAAAADLEICLDVMIKALRTPKAATLFEYADNPLARYGNYRPSEQQIVANMIERLRVATGEDFGYEVDGSDAENEAAIAAWEQWFSGRSGEQ